MDHEKFDDVNARPKKRKSTTLIIFAGVSTVAVLAILVYSEFEKYQGKEMQNQYHAKIKDIEKYLSEKNCTQSIFEYNQAKEIRDEIVKRGLYYSLHSHAAQAHAIEIAECFSDKNEFDAAVQILNTEKSRDPDYLLRASVIYENGGELEKAKKAKQDAEKF